MATTDEFDAWFGTLNDASQVEVIAKVELLKMLGPQLSRPHADTLKNSQHANLKELRASTGEQVLRVAFAFDPHRQAILLIGGNKAGVSERRFYKQLIARADRLFTGHLKRLADEERE